MRHGKFLESKPVYTWALLKRTFTNTLIYAIKKTQI